MYASSEGPISHPHYINTSLTLLCNLFPRMFQAYPQLLPNFTTLKGMDFETMKQHYKLRAHAGSFKSGITSFIDHLDDLPCLQLLLQRHSAAHYELGLRAEVFKVGLKNIDLYLAHEHPVVLLRKWSLSAYAVT